MQKQLFSMRLAAKNETLPSLFRTHADCLEAAKAMSEHSGMGFDIVCLSGLNVGGYYAEFETPAGVRVLVCDLVKGKGA